MAMHVYSSSRKRRGGGFPVGAVVLLALGGYWLYSQTKPATSSTPATIAPGEPSPSPPATLPPSQPVATATPATLSPVTTALTARQVVQQAAQSLNNASWKAMAQTASDQDIQLVATMIQGEWAQYGRCKTTACMNNWSYIVNRYNIQ